MIKKQGKQYCVISHTTGKKLACYKTKKEAKADLERRRKFKHMKKGK